MPKKIKVENAVGLKLSHDITEIRKGEFKGRAFKKGHVIRHEDICHFHRLGKQHVFIEEEEQGFVHEDEAIKLMANALCGQGIIQENEPVEGKLKFYAACDGLLKVETEALSNINLLGDVMCATRHSNTMVKTGDIVAAARAIPLFIDRKIIDQAIRMAQSPTGVVKILPLKKATVGILITGNEVYHHIIEDQFESILRSKISNIGSEVKEVAFAPDNPDFISGVIKRFLDSGIDLILTTGGMSVDPDDVTRIGVLKSGAEECIYGSPVLPGAMFMIAYIGNVPVLGVPACGIYHETTMLDLILPRVLAGELIGRKEIAAMGHGGLCLDCPTCRFPLCPFGK
jgi:hypothetical protein